MNLSETLEEVLRIINCTPDDVRRFVQQHPPEKRLTKVRQRSQTCITAPEVRAALKPQDVPHLVDLC